MRNWSRKKLILSSVLLIILIFVLYRQLFPSTPAISSKSGSSPGESIASLEKIELGGMEQWVLIRGNDTSNPVLLWLHGGPGSSQMPISRYYNKDLEKDFIVVHWDQRGAGKSNPPSFDESTMSFEQFVKDGHELTNYLKNRFNREKIYLLGHSWGTQFGIELARDYPEDYYAYIGVSQVVDNNTADEIAYKWLKTQTLNTARDANKLNKLGPPPYKDHSAFVKFIKMVDSYEGGMDVSMGRLTLAALSSREYRLSDYISWLRGSTRGSGPMWDSLQSFNLFGSVTELQLPVYFFSGKNDYNTPMELVEEYISILNAPKGKHMIIFDKSAHTPFMAEPERFYQELKKVRDDTYIN